MHNLKQIFKSIGLAFVLIIILSFIITFLNYFNIINSILVSVFDTIVPLLSLAIGSFFSGKNCLKNGWLEGLKIGLIFIVLVFFGNIIFDNSIDFKNLLFYLLLLISSILGSIFGINFKKEK